MKCTVIFFLKAILQHDACFSLPKLPRLSLCLPFSPSFYLCGFVREGEREKGRGREKGSEKEREKKWRSWATWQGWGCGGGGGGGCVEDTERLADVQINLHSSFYSVKQFSRRWPRPGPPATGTLQEPEILQNKLENKQSHGVTSTVLYLQSQRAWEERRGERVMPPTPQHPPLLPSNTHVVIVPHWGFWKGVALK